MTADNITSERKTIVLVAVLFLNLILVSTSVPVENNKTLFQGIVGAIVAPFQIGFQKSVDYISQQLKHYVFLKNSFEKLTELEKKQAQLMYENYLLKQKIADQDFLNILKVEMTHFIKADVISLDMNFPLSSLLIDKGTKDGIVKDMIVLNDKGQLVGKIVNPISVFSSKVRLVTCSIGGIGAYIDTDRLEGFLTGNNSELCNFKYLIENKTVNIGDLVITSGTDRIFPPYIPIGKVKRVQKEYLTQKIEVEPFFIKSSFKQLIVISNDQPPISGSQDWMDQNLPPSVLNRQSPITN
jgi:rod shape-determining protein MreC